MFVSLSNNEMTNSHAMPRACMLVNDTIVATLVSDLTIRDVCAVLSQLLYLLATSQKIRLLFGLFTTWRIILDGQGIANCTSKSFPLIVDMFMLTISSETEDALL